MNAWGRAWVGLTLALAVHVADEAAGGFLDFYNPVAQSVRDSVGLPFPPSFQFATWLGGLVLVVVLLLVLSAGTSRGWRWMRPASYGFAVIMIANGLGHIAASALSGILIPGTLTSPLILAAAGWLIYASRPPAQNESPGGSA